MGPIHENIFLNILKLYEKKLIFNKLQYKLKKNKNIFIFIYYIYVEIPFPIGCILPQAAPNSLSFFIKSNNDLTALG